VRDDPAAIFWAGGPGRGVERWAWALNPAGGACFGASPKQPAHAVGGVPGSYFFTIGLERIEAPLKALLSAQER